MNGFLSIEGQTDSSFCKGWVKVAALYGAPEEP
jgi:hypothetical protein